jgi:hypothetical protein
MGGSPLPPHYRDETQQCEGEDDGLPKVHILESVARWAIGGRGAGGRAYLFNKPGPASP